MRFDKVAGRDFLAAITLANFSFLHVWSQLLTYTREQSFYLERPPLPAQYAAATADVLLLGIVLFGAIRLARRIGNRYGAVWLAPVVTLLTLLPVNAARSSFAIYFPILRSGPLVAIGVKSAILVYICLSLIGAFLLLRLQTRVAGIVMLALVECSPLLAVEAAAAVWHLRRENPQAYLNGPLAPASAARTDGSHVVWIIFDELDYRLLFPERPPSVNAPEFDRLRSQALFATDALPPSNATLTSIPSLLTGHRILTVSTPGPGVMLAGWAGASNPQRLDRTPTIFSVARRLGRNTAVAGWYLPYCRVFNADLNSCFWGSFGDLIIATGGAFPENVVQQARSLFETGVFSPFRQSLLVENRIRMQDRLRREALRDVADPSLGLVFLHYPVPHSPYTYDRFRHAFTKRNATVTGYLDSLALADLILGEVRKTMTAAGLWDTTTVLVSADHWFRAAMQLDGKEDHRVPFLLKLSGQTAGVEYNQPLYTVVSKALLESVLRGEVHTPEETLNWLGSHSVSR